MTEIDNAPHAERASRLRAELEDLAHQSELGKEGLKTVTLDQQSVGRLSRMDALQGQAMARATSARRTARIAAIQAAFARMEDGEYGFCIDCGEDIPSTRLDLDPAVTKCISCARG